ncbi:HvfC/BufC N-terminal domain-containing protein [Pontixanthobacter luteolus]|uniref:HvfC/BufC N-terminal domain-containing protein n=1 Tax=Pontixanthobacter luteolus TaxID=295089 RepID=UPI00230417C6|nr:DNA-binding domain-containing protein [Pontixanthobacter luteolus]
MSAQTIADLQQDFMAHVLDDTSALPEGWTGRHAQGLAIYRNAYRARLFDALRGTYERTAKWVGEDAFRRAAAHHLITCPPCSWTLDDAGNGFADTLEQLFADDPEVAELAWLEGAMHRCFVAADAQPVDGPAFAEATGRYNENEWARLRFKFVPGMEVRRVDHDIIALWRSLGDGIGEAGKCASVAGQYCAVWRDGFKPVFMLTDTHEGEALCMMLGGQTFGEVCAHLVGVTGEGEGVAQAGAILANWLRNGLIAGLA